MWSLQEFCETRGRMGVFLINSLNQVTWWRPPLKRSFVIMKASGGPLYFYHLGYTLDRWRLSKWDCLMTIKSQQHIGTILRGNYRQAPKRGVPYSGLQMKIKLVTSEKFIPYSNTQIVHELCMDTCNCLLKSPCLNLYIMPINVYIKLFFFILEYSYYSRCLR